MSNRQGKIKSLQDETKRRELVAKEKELGRQIEQIEKSRIYEDVISIKRRISFQIASFRASAKVLRDATKLDDKASDGAKQGFSIQIKLYKSIRRDICHTLEKKEKNFCKKFEDIFPEISFSTEKYNDIVRSYLGATEQLIQINLFLDRYLK